MDRPTNYTKGTEIGSLLIVPGNLSVLTCSSHDNPFYVACFSLMCVVAVVVVVVAVVVAVVAGAGAVAVGGVVAVAAVN